MKGHPYADRFCARRHRMHSACGACSRSSRPSAWTDSQGSPVVSPKGSCLEFRKARVNVRESARAQGSAVAAERCHFGGAIGRE